MKISQLLLVCWALFLGWSCSTHIPNPEIDSAYQTAWELYTVDLRQAKAHALGAYTLAKSSGSCEQQAKTAFLLALIEIVEDEFNDAYIHFSEAEISYTQLGNNEYRQRSRYQLAIILIEAQQWQKALSLLNECTPFFSVNGPTSVLLNVYAAKARAHHSLGNTKEALNTLYEAKSLTDTSTGLTSLLFNVHYSIGDYHLKSKALDSALFHMKQAMTHARASESAVLLRQAHSNLAEVFFRQGNYTDAIAAAREGLQLLEGSRDYQRLAALYRYNLADALWAGGEVAEARAVLEPVARLQPTEHWNLAMEELVALCLLQQDHEAASRYTQQHLQWQKREQPTEAKISPATLALLNTIQEVERLQTLAAQQQARKRWQPWLVIGGLLLLGCIGFLLQRMWLFQRNRHLFRKYAIGENETMLTLLDLLKADERITPEELTEYVLLAGSVNLNTERIKDQALPQKDNTWWQRFWRRP